MGSEPSLLESADPFVRGWEYLQTARQLAPAGDVVAISDDIGLRIRICTWIGENISAVNQELADCLEACHQCFYPANRPQCRILAVPLASRLRLDALCNILVEPTTILIDVGRVPPPDWLAAVVHEYAHAYLKAPGHDRPFYDVLTHLCLGLGLSPPPLAVETLLRHWPPYHPPTDPRAFWLGAQYGGD